MIKKLKESDLRKIIREKLESTLNRTALGYGAAHPYSDKHVTNLGKTAVKDFIEKNSEEKESLDDTKPVKISKAFFNKANSS